MIPLSLVLFSNPFSKRLPLWSSQRWFWTYHLALITYVITISFRRCTRLARYTGPFNMSSFFPFHPNASPVSLLLPHMNPSLVILFSEQATISLSFLHLHTHYSLRLNQTILPGMNIQLLSSFHWLCSLTWLFLYSYSLWYNSISKQLSIILSHWWTSVSYLQDYKHLNDYI